MTGIQSAGDAYLIITEIEPLKGTYYVGTTTGSPDPTRTYLDLTTVAQLLRENYIENTVIFEMLSTYDDNTEVIPIVFDILMKINSTDEVIIRPRTGVSGVTTTRSGANSNEAILYIDNITHLRFDGRQNGAGSTIDWTFSNNGSSGEGQVFEFRNDACENTLRYLNITSDVQESDNGVIRFGTGTTTGNDDNTIEYCDITGRTTTPFNLIYAAGTSGAENSGNTIDYNNIYNFFNPDDDCNGVFIAANNSGWNITNNKLYQTATRTYTSGGGVYCAIRIVTPDQNEHTISGNTVGYANSSSTGTTTLNGSQNSRFAGIWLETDNAHTATDIMSNTISNISILTNYTGWNDNCGTFSAIYIEDGDVNIGATGTGNIIGSSSSTGAISVEHRNGSYCYGVRMRARGNTQTIVDNEIGGMSCFGTAVNEITYVQVIELLGWSANATISDNTIGSTSTANSIQSGKNTTTTNTSLGGINVTPSDGNVTVNNNTIANLTSHGKWTNDAWLRGIDSDGGVTNITNNTIYTLTSYSRTYGTTYRPAIAGILHTSKDGNTNITGNEIYDLNGANTDTDFDFTIRIAGICTSTNPTINDNISNNFVHNLHAGTATANKNAVLSGIFVDNGMTTVRNNMIQMGIDDGGASIIDPYEIHGIYHRSEYSCNYYYNSVYVGGSGVTGAKNTSAFYKYTTNISTINNNIFYNARSGGGTNYAYVLSYDEGVVADHNIYYAPNTGGVLANFDGTDFTTMQAIKAYQYNGNDFRSGSGDPVFMTPTGTNSTTNLHITVGASPVESAALEIAGITTDIDGNIRSVSPLFPDIGADEGAFTMDASVDIYCPTFEYTPIANIACGTKTASINLTVYDAGTGLSLSANKPRLWYRIYNTSWGTWDPVPGTLIIGSTPNISNWSFTISSLSNGDIVEYYFVAQDQATTPNIGYSKFDLTTPVHSNVATQTTAPNANVDVDVFSVCQTMSGNYDIPGDYTNLTGYDQFFYDVNSSFVSGDITVTIGGNITEPATYGLDEFQEIGVGNWTIRVQNNDNATNHTLTCSANKTMLRMQGADRVTFDGRFNETGTDKYLTYEHTTNDNAVFSFSDNATNNVIRYSTIQSSPQISASGVVRFDSTEVAAGNDNNTIEYNSITKYGTEYPFTIIYSRGNKTAGNENSDNTIQNNEISEFQSHAVWVTSHGNDDNWTISSNTMFSACVSDSLAAVIAIENGSGHTVSNNFIGGSDNTLGGNALENSSDRQFDVIYFNCDDDALSTISGNTIKNVEASLNESARPFSVIRVDNGLIDITNNTIEDIETVRDYIPSYVINYNGKSGFNITGNVISNITFSISTNSYTDADVYTIYAVPEDADNINHINTNTIKGINITCATDYVDYFGIYNYDTNTEIDGNIFGGTNAADKVEYNGEKDFFLIYVDADDVFNQNVSNNNMSNIRSVQVIANDNAKCLAFVDGKVNVTGNIIGTSANGISNTGNEQLYGIWTNIDYEPFTIDNNTVSNLNSTDGVIAIRARGVDSDYDYSVSGNTISGFTITNDIPFVGIEINRSSTISVQNNTIQDITMNNGGSNTSFIGFDITAGNTIKMGTTTGNTIGHATTANSININGSFAKGIDITTGGVTCENNLIANMTFSSAATLFMIFDLLREA